MKAALITGAAKRIGKAIADRLLREEYRLILHAHSSFSDLNAWLADHCLKDRVIGVVQADLSLEGGQDELISAVKKRLSSLDLIVHNASTFSPRRFGEISRESYREMMAVNLDAPFFITQSLLPLLRNAHSPSVVNIVDAMWERPSPKFSHYAVSKAGLAILTRSLASELAPQIRVNAVAPGAILFQPFHTDAMRESTIQGIPHNRLGDPTDIADAVVFLSEHAQYVAGEILVIDGGRSISP